MSRHIPYIDGLKGLCALYVVVFHYLLAFDAKGYVGWNSGIAVQEQWGHFWSYFPLSLFTNANYVLYMFFAIIAFIPAYRFFQGQDRQWLQKQALVRYFRFLPYTFIMIPLSYVFFSQGWYFNQELAQVLQEPWNAAVMSQHMMLTGAVWSGLLGAMIVGASDYLTSLWCMHIIFIGSYLSYALLLFFGEVRHRCALYLFLWILLYNAPLYVSFLAGIAAADIYHAKNVILSKKSYRFLLGIGLLATFAGSAPWASLEQGKEIASFLQYALQSFGTFSILLAVCLDEELQGFFLKKVFLHCSRYCFEYIIVHVFILFSISAWIFLHIHATLGYAMAFIIAGITAIPLNIIGAVAFGKILQPLAAWLSGKAYAFFLSKK